MSVAEATVVVLRSEDFATIEDLIRARAAVAAPVLFRIRAGELEAMLPALRDGDDLCLATDPARRQARRARSAPRLTIPGIRGRSGSTPRRRSASRSRRASDATL